MNTLFDPIPAYQPHSETSMQAALSVVGKTKTLRETVYEALAQTPMTDEQIAVPDGFPLLKGARPPASEVWEHTLWGMQMEEWLASVNQPATYAMQHFKPICIAKILP